MNNSPAKPASRFEPEKYGLFSIDDFEFAGGVFKARYSLVSEQDSISLTETIDFGGLPRVADPDERLLRLLALACSLSYYKTIGAIEIRVGFELSIYEISFLQSLIAKGLAEFAFTNNLPAKLSPHILPLATVAPAHTTERGPHHWSIASRPLVAVGGGKDSVVSIEALKRTGTDPVLFSVNTFDPISRCVEVSGCEYLHVSRILDDKIFALSATGAFNGHVPVTAINSIIGLVIADVAGLGSLVMSNERSANYGNLTWDGIDVNHQWSKSLEFEDLLRSCLTASGMEADRYFSLLRSKREIDIARDFSHSQEYFGSFTSCNRVFKMDPTHRYKSWCGECAKCLFIFLILAPFIPKTQLIAFFGSNPLADKGNFTLYRQIVGVQGIKPFDCVGEFDEAVEAFTLLGSMSEWESDPIRVLIASELPTAVAFDREQPNFEDRVPNRFQRALDGLRH